MPPTLKKHNYILCIELHRIEPRCIHPCHNNKAGILKHIILNKMSSLNRLKPNDTIHSFLQLWKTSIARSRNTLLLCRTAMTAPHLTCQGEGSLGNAVAEATCPKRQCKFFGAGCTSTASMPTHQSRRSSVCQVRPTSLCCR